MYRIDNSSAVPAAPAPPSPGAPGYFSNGNPPAAVAATIVDDWWLNQIQEEILTVVTRAGLTPNKTDTTQLYQALQRLIPRERLSAPSTVYVSPSGSDTTGDGSTPGTAWQTLQHAVNVITGTVDFGGQTVTVQMADGTYTAPCYAAGAPIGAIVNGPIIITGNPSSAGAVVINVTGNCIEADVGAALRVQNLSLQATAGATGGYALAATFGGYLEFANVIFNACTNAHLYAVQGGRCRAVGSYTISGSAANHALAGIAGYLELSAGTMQNVTLTGTPAFASGFAFAGSGGQLLAPTNAFSGAATGLRYNATINGVIDTRGGGASYFPGSIAGTTSNGGAYN